MIDGGFNPPIRPPASGPGIDRRVGDGNDGASHGAGPGSPHVGDEFRLIAILGGKATGTAARGDEIEHVRVVVAV
jgi:hypothetical protein